MKTKEKKDTAKVAGSKKKPVTTAIHVQSKDGAKHAVGIGNLRVMLFNDDGSWFAQGLEIDYFAQGSSMEDVQQRFHNGLRETIDYHLMMFGNIDGVLRVAPSEVWAELVGTGNPLKRSYSTLSFHVDPEKLSGRPFYDGIEYYEKTAA